MPTIPSCLARGDSRPLLAWLIENVHGQGSRWPTPELVERATGKPLDPQVFRAHLERRYLA
jgi:carboxypeptidase Taq